VEEVQRVRSLGARGAGAEITSEPIVQMKARTHTRIRLRCPLARIAPHCAVSVSHFRFISSAVPFRCAVQGLDKFTTALVTRVEAREGGSGGSSTLRTRVRVEAALFGVQRTHTTHTHTHTPESKHLLP
jgi:hypothetical protein